MIAVLDQMGYISYDREPDAGVGLIEYRDYGDREEDFSGPSFRDVCFFKNNLNKDFEMEEHFYMIHESYQLQDFYKLLFKLNLLTGEINPDFFHNGNLDFNISSKRIDENLDLSYIITTDENREVIKQYLIKNFKDFCINLQENIALSMSKLSIGKFPVKDDNIKYSIEFDESSANINKVIEITDLLNKSIIKSEIKESLWYRG